MTQVVVPISLDNWSSTVLPMSHLHAHHQYPYTMIDNGKPITGFVVKYNLA